MTAADLPRESIATIARVTAFSAIVPLALLVAPLLTTQLLAERGLTSAQAGAYFLFELGGISLASLPALWWSRRFEARTIAVAAVLVFVAGNLASMAAPSVPALFGARLVTAIAGGALMILCMSTAGASPRRDRLFGYWISGQLVLGAAGLALLPALFARFGLNAFYAVLALLMAALLPLARGFERPPPRARRPMARTGAGPLALASAAAVFAFYMGLGGTWAFAGLLAAAAGIGPGAIAATLAIASLLGIAGAFLATALGARLPRRLTLPTGCGLMIVAILLLLGRPDLPRFTVAAGLFKFAWTFALPFILAAIANRDRRGGLMALVNLLIGSGTSLGPLLAGQILGHGGFAALLIVSAGLVAAALVLLLLIEAGRFSEEGA